MEPIDVNIKKSNDILKSLFYFEGRIKRSVFIKTVIPLNLLISGLLIAIAVSTGNLRGVLIGLASIISPLAIWVMVTAYIKRWHDLNKSGWLTLTLLIPAANLLILLYLCFSPSIDGYNRYEANQYLRFRPVGLSILAILNFEFTIFFILMASLVAIAYFWPDTLFVGNSSEIGIIEVIIAGILYPLINSLLLLLSGIGFLKMRYMLGFVTGNISVVYAFVAVLFIAITYGTAKYILLIYPFVLLLLLNTVYKKYFIQSEKRPNK